jgi:thiopurine S-methyltransferase
MEQLFWHQRWEENRIGFHLAETNELLEKYLPILGLQQDDKIFVPLCGKTLDMIYLKQQKLKVLGNEISPLAVNDFFNENNLPFNTKAVQLSTEKVSSETLQMKSYFTKQIEIIQGDFFKLEKSMMSGVKAVYDRASMVALPEEMRKSYVDYLLKILPRPTRILLVSLEYNQELKQGPPFSVHEDEISYFYKNDFDIKLLYTQETPMKQRGKVSKNMTMKEKVFLLRG